MSTTVRPVEGQCGKGEEKPVRLAAFHDDELSVEAAEQLVQMTKDESLPTHGGKNLPTADRAAVLVKIKAKRR